MTWHRTLLGVLSLVALVVALCVPPTAAHAELAEPVVVSAVASEPCPATSSLRRCEIKALPIAAVASGIALDGAAAVGEGASGVGRGLWPEVEPDPPRIPA